MVNCWVQFFSLRQLRWKIITKTNKLQQDNFWGSLKLNKNFLAMVEMVNLEKILRLGKIFKNSSEFFNNFFGTKKEIIDKIAGVSCFAANSRETIIYFRSAQYGFHQTITIFVVFDLD